MVKFKHQKATRRIAIAISFVIVTLILWNTYQFVQKFKSEERQKMEILSKAFEHFGKADLNEDVDLERFILGSNSTIPVIITDTLGNIASWNNTELDEKRTYKSLNPEEKEYIEGLLTEMKNQNPPITISFEVNNFSLTQYLYHGNSTILSKLKYYPLTLILILVLFTSVISLFFISTKTAEQNKLWTGMAKETAHQIGTPLSSLLGWIELLKYEDIDPNIVPEIKKDVDRLNQIADRFSKIGSVPVLSGANIINQTETALKYLQDRNSKQVQFSFNAPKKDITVMLNIELYGWVIENLIKNAIDAMQGKGAINIKIIDDFKYVKILIQDTGKGISKNKFKEIFAPGYTTKKRGWGLGLSLSKRIIEEYHDGRIYVKDSEVDKGTTFCISLKKVNA